MSTERITESRSEGLASNAANDNLIDRTIKTWQPRLGQDLSREDARQIVENVIGFFSILAQWSRAEPAKPANDTGKPGGANNRQL